MGERFQDDDPVHHVGAVLALDKVAGVNVYECPMCEIF